MKAWFLNEISDLRTVERPLSLEDIPKPIPYNHEILIHVSCCGICHTELDEIEGRSPPPKYPVIPGHQIIGVVDQCGDNANRFTKGERVGVAWIFSTCGNCEYCLAGLENL